MNEFTVKPVAYIRTDFKEKFGIPRQSGRAPSLTAEIVFTPEYRHPDALRGIDDFSHLWLIFDFSKAHREEWSPTVRPPRLGGNTRVGVFVSRSPYRPNPIGLSCVKLLLIVSGADLLDGTPVLDIKPYIPFADCITDAKGGYASQHQNDKLQVIFPAELLNKVTEDKRQGLTECLADDPRPSYQNDPARIYGIRFGEYEIKFTVQKGVLTVNEVQEV